MVLYFATVPSPKKRNDLTVKKQILEKFSFVTFQLKSISIIMQMLQSSLKKLYNVIFCFVILLLLLRAIRFISKALSFVVSLTSENSLKYHCSLQSAK